MRVAVLNDIHGNLPALEAVLPEADAAGVDAVVLGGDFVDGPLQSETLEVLDSLGERAVWLRGNCERNVVEVFDGTFKETGAEHQAGTVWGGRQLTRAWRDRLAALPMTVTLEVEGLGPVLFCHATARDDEELVLVDSPEEWFTEGFEGTDEPLVVLGHTHMPFDRLAAGRRFVNAGSVGMPYGPPGAAAYWAVLGPDVTLRRTPYDARAAADRLSRSGWPGTAAFVEENVLAGPPTDTEALAVFTGIARERRER